MRFFEVLVAQKCLASGFRNLNKKIRPFIWYGKIPNTKNGKIPNTKNDKIQNTKNDKIPNTKISSIFAYILSIFFF